MFFNRKEERAIETGADRIRNLLVNDNTEDYTDTESTYYSCIKIISESIAKTSIKIKKNNEEIQHKWNDCLALRANPNMSITDCIQTLVRYTKHYGIGALYIDYVNKYLYPVRVNSIVIDNIGLIKSTKINKVMYVVEDSANTLYDVTEDNLIILKDNPINGIECRSTKDICSTSLKSAISANRYLKDLFANGLTNKLIVQLASDIQEEDKLAEIQARFNRMFSTQGRILTVPAMYRVEPLNLSLADSQFVDLKKLSKQEIAVAMGVPLSKLGIKQETAKSNEQDNLDFLTDTLQIIFTKLEKEMNYKLLTNKERQSNIKIEFNIGSLLRLDAKTQADVVNSYVKQGIYSIQYARKILGIYSDFDNETVLVPSGSVTLNNLINGNASWQKDNESDEGGE
ncbi:phage portal protein [Clostridium tetani]|uniref:Phage portal protein n=1 Tax=Clostridium tetani TaxID=1513 RepID=A0ABY0EQU3_CLOTA|nr:phage portal protein [Clostridium tetani]RXI57420.1 phage portal protein [Clostridium tetani]RXI66998.1 phage portal protein [Clostridium tetani]